MASGVPKPQVDTSRPHSARVYDYLLGGKDNYLVDQQLADLLPDLVAHTARQNRAFMHRAVAWSARSGIDQFLDVGTGIPTQPNLHQVAQGVDPAARVVYVDNDPIVLRHAEALLVSAPEGRTDYLHADVRDPAAILERAGGLLDLDRPVALSLVALLHFVLDEEDPYGIVRTFLDALAPGSHLVLSHATMDTFPGPVDHEQERMYRSNIPNQMRTRAEVERFFDGLDLVEPGVVTPAAWFKDTPAPDAGDLPVLLYAGVARLP
ncbi:SAM-dependent methyltransferase [Streptomyces sp. NRRL F-5126]|uniref:SAM-dependent methyltransferase n=1 Tax=Streptomyces sp. NRRL F-5126 TaxID=1463857 RepID=UPI0004C8EC98|nr:SAM-dependent methyltransferase [Streptomyces sp. NRRL F-5126]